MADLRPEGLADEDRLDPRCLYRCTDGTSRNPLYFTHDDCYAQRIARILQATSLHEGDVAPDNYIPRRLQVPVNITVTNEHVTETLDRGKRIVVPASEIVRNLRLSLEQVFSREGLRLNHYHMDNVLVTESYPLHLALSSNVAPATSTPVRDVLKGVLCVPPCAMLCNSYGGGFPFSLQPKSELDEEAFKDYRIPLSTIFQRTGQLPLPSEIEDGRKCMAAVLRQYEQLDLVMDDATRLGRIDWEAYLPAYKGVTECVEKEFLTNEALGSLHANVFSVETGCLDRYRDCYTVNRLGAGLPEHVQHELGEVHSSWDPLLREFPFFPLLNLEATKHGEARGDDLKLQIGLPNDGLLVALQQGYQLNVKWFFEFVIVPHRSGVAPYGDLRSVAFPRA